MDTDDRDCTTDAMYMYSQVDNRAALTIIEDLEISSSWRQHLLITFEDMY